MTKTVKKENQVTRVTAKEKAEFAKAAEALGWKDPSALLSAVIGLVNAGKLEIKPPAPQQPTVHFKD